MSTRRHWYRSDAGKANAHFPRDNLGRRAKKAFVEWKASLSRSQKRTLNGAPR